MTRTTMSDMNSVVKNPSTSECGDTQWPRGKDGGGFLLFFTSQILRERSIVDGSTYYKILC